MGCDYSLELRNYKSINCLKPEKGHFQEKWSRKRPILLPSFIRILCSVFEDEECPGYWDTTILQNQENYGSIIRFTPLKLAIWDQKRAKNCFKYPKFPLFSDGS